jgi:hypothetical protein
MFDPRVQQSTRHWRHPTDPATREIRFIDADNSVNRLLAGVIAHHNRSAKNDAVACLSRRRNDLDSFQILLQLEDPLIESRQFPFRIRIIRRFQQARALSSTRRASSCRSRSAPARVI